MNEWRAKQQNIRHCSLTVAKVHRPGIEPGAGRHLGSKDLGWQRPILPLNHQCFLMSNHFILTIYRYFCRPMNQRNKTCRRKNSILRFYPHVCLANLQKQDILRTGTLPLSDGHPQMDGLGHEVFPSMIHKRYTLCRSPFSHLLARREGW